MKSSHSVTACAALVAAIPAALMAQVPPEMLGGGQLTPQSMKDGAFYRSPEAVWMEVAPPQKNGLGCIVTYVTLAGSEGAATPGDTISYLGPANAQEAGTNEALAMLIGPRIPAPKNEAGKTPITVFTNEGPAKVNATHMSMGEWNTFVVGFTMSDFIDDTADKETIRVEYKGKEIYRVDVVELAKARSKLRTCMADYKGKRGK